MRRGTTAIIVVGLTLVGCGGGSDGDEATTTEQPADPADLAIAEAALLRLSDFPSGWSEVPDTEEEVSDELNDAQLELAACFGSETESLLDFSPANAETGDFTSPDDDVVSNTVSVSDQAAAEDFMDRYGADGVAECLTEASAKVVEVGFSETDDVPDDLTLGTVTVGRLNLTPVGDELVAYRITIPLSAGGLQVEVYLDLIAVRVERGVSGISVESLVFPMNASEIEEYVAIAAERLASAL